MKTIMAIATLTLMAAWSAPAQEAGAEQKMVAEQKMKVALEHALVNAKFLNVEGGIMGPAVKGAPYTANEMTERNHVLSDGTNIHNENKARTYRDGMGRIRREAGDEIVIMDPVNGVRYALHPGEHSATKMPMGVTAEAMTDMQRHVVVVAGGGMAGGPGMMMAGPGPILGPAPDAVIAQTFVNDGVNIGYKALARGGKVEDLGTQSMEGVVVQGTRTTRTIETGAIGNDRPINMVSERWFSPDLQTLVMSKQTDPRDGETVFKLTGIQRGEPDPSLFQVPAGYQVNEPTTFTTTRPRE